MVRAIRLALRIGRSEPLVSQLELKPHSTDKKNVFWPGDADPDIITDSEIEGFIRDHAETNYHPVSSLPLSYFFSRQSHLSIFFALSGVGWNCENWSKHG